MQRVYGLNIDRLGYDFDMLHLADLAANMPLGSRLIAEYVPQAAYTMTETLLHAQLNASMGRENRIPFPWEERSNGLGLEFQPMEEDALIDYLTNSTWKEVEYDGDII